MSLFCRSINIEISFDKLSINNNFDFRIILKVSNLSDIFIGNFNATITR